MQGGWEEDEPAAEVAATREAYEEAGVQGIIGATLSPATVDAKSQAHLVRVAWFVLYVDDLKAAWPEADERCRCVVPLDEALGLVARKEHRDAILEV